jgi:drug/metabolite transporter (DMT)-like permease
MEPVGFVAWRAGTGTLALIALLLLARTALPAMRDLPTSQRAALAVASVMALALNLFVFAAFERTSVALVLIGFYTYPAMVALVAILLGRDRPTAGVLLALLLAMIGMVLVVAGSLGATAGLRLEPLGFALALGAAASQTVFVTVSRDGYPAVPTEIATAMILGASLVGCLVLGLATGLGRELALPLTEPVSLLPIVVVAGVFVAALPSVLFLTAIRRVGGTRAGIVMLLEPVVGVVLAAVLLHEALRPVQLVGAAAVLGAALLLQLSGSRPAGSGVRAADPAG